MPFLHTHTITAFAGSEIHIYKVELMPNGMAHTKIRDEDELWSCGLEGRWTGPKHFDNITVAETGNYANSPTRLAIREEGRLKGLEKSKYYNEHDQARAMRKGRPERARARYTVSVLRMRLRRSALGHLHVSSSGHSGPSCEKPSLSRAGVCSRTLGGQRT